MCSDPTEVARETRGESIDRFACEGSDKHAAEHVFSVCYWCVQAKDKNPSTWRRATTPPTATHNLHTANLHIHTSPRPLTRKHAKAPPQSCHNSTTTTKKAQTFSAPCKETEKNVPDKHRRRPASQRLTTQQLCEGPTLSPRLKNPSRH